MAGGLSPSRVGALLAVACAVAFYTARTNAETLTVPTAGFTVDSIRTTVESAVSGDVVVVPAGTWSGCGSAGMISPTAGNLTIRGTGAGLTIISCVGGPPMVGPLFMIAGAGSGPTDPVTTVANMSLTGAVHDAAGGGFFGVDAARLALVDLQVSNTFVFENLGAATSGIGGVIYAENADVVATRVTFRNSTAVGLGGVMYGLNANLSATDVVVDDVRSDDRGGFAYINGGVVTLVRVSADDVSANNRGGFIYILSGHLEVHDSEFTLTFAGRGGVFFVDLSSIGVRDVYFHDCLKSDRGGVVYITGAGDRPNYFGDTLVERVEGDRGNFMYMTGTDTQPTLIERLTIREHIGDRGGGFYLLGNRGMMTVVDSVFYDIDAGLGGVFYQAATDMTARNLTFTNVVCDAGCAAYITNSNNTLYEDITVTNTEADVQGGVFYLRLMEDISLVPVVIRRVVSANNKCPSGSFLKGSMASRAALDDITVTGNEVDDTDASIQFGIESIVHVVESSEVSLNRFSAVGNNAPVLLAWNSSLTVTNSLLANNNGGLFCDSAMARISVDAASVVCGNALNGDPASNVYCNNSCLITGLGGGEDCLYSGCQFGECTFESDGEGYTGTGCASCVANFAGDLCDQCDGDVVELECQAAVIEGGASAALIVILVALLVLILCGVAAYFGWQKWKRRPRTWKDGDATAKVNFDLGDHVDAEIKSGKAKLIGGGGASQVYKMRMLDGSTAAVKLLTLGVPGAEEEFRQENHILAKLQGHSHPNVIELLFFTSEPLALGMTYCSKGSLHAFIEKKKRNKKFASDWPLKMDLLVQAAHGLDFLHQRRIYHLDVKTRNILIAGDNPDEPTTTHGICLKLIDFGASSEGDFQYTTPDKAIFAGTLSHTPPERFMAATAIDLRAIDSFSFAMVARAVWLHEEPFSEVANNRLLGLISSNPDLRPDIPDATDIEAPVPRALCTRVIRPCWNSDWTQRPLFPDIVDALAQICRDNSLGLNDDLDDMFHLSSRNSVLAPHASDIEENFSLSGTSTPIGDATAMSTLTMDDLNTV